MINFKKIENHSISNYLKRGVSLSLAILTIGSTLGCKGSKKKEQDNSILTSQIEESDYSDSKVKEKTAKKEDIIGFNNYACSKYYGNYTLFDSVSLTDQYNSIIDSMFEDLYTESRINFSEIDNEKFREYIIMPYIVKQEKNNNKNIDTSFHKLCYDNVLIIPMDDDGLSKYANSEIVNLNGFYKVCEHRSLENGDFSTEVFLSDKNNCSYITYSIVDNNLNYIYATITDETAYLYIFNNNKKIFKQIREKDTKYLFDKLNMLTKVNSVFDINLFILQYKEYLTKIFGDELDEIIVKQYRDDFMIKNQSSNEESKKKVYKIEKIY